MSLLVFSVVAAVTGGSSLALIDNRRVSAAFGLIGLVLAVGAGTRIGSGDAIRIAGTTLAASEFARMYLTLGSVAGLLIALLALVTSWPAALPGAWLLVLAASGLGLGLADPGAAAVAVTVGALAGIAVTVGATATPDGLRIARRELRAVVAAGVLGLAGASVATAQTALSLDPAIVGVAWIGFAAGVAIRLGSIPFHLWVARSADTAPPVGLPLVMAWAPAVFVVVALTWVNGSIVALGEPLSIERALIVLVAAMTIVLAATAAVLHQDLEHVVGYSIVSDGAFALLGLTILDPSSWEPTRTFILTFAVTKTAFAALIAALHYTYGARQVAELNGWARRSPLLGVALAGIFVAGVGVPGTPGFQARLDLVALALGQPLATGLWALSLVSIAYYGRLAIVGLRRPSVAVRSGADPIPRWPSPRRSGSRADVVADTTALLRANRAPIAAGLVLVLSGLAVTLAVGGLGVRAAAAGARPSPAFEISSSVGEVASPAP